MQISMKKVAFVLFSIAWFCHADPAQILTRDLNLGDEANVSVSNRFGRVTVQATPAVEDRKAIGKLTATSTSGVADKEVRVSGLRGKVVIDVDPTDQRKRIDLNLVLPERSQLKIETASGAVEVSGNFDVIEAKTDTGTIAADVPAEDLTYHFIWTESRPRYLADFEIAAVKEKSGGRFEIKGERTKEEGEKGRKGEVESKMVDPAINVSVSNLDKKKPKIEDKESKSVTLNFTTARGIILLNVPPNEVMS